MLSLPRIFSLIPVLFAGCAASYQPSNALGGGIPQGIDLDSTLFEIVLASIDKQSVWGPLRVDPRPLRPDPRLVSIAPLSFLDDQAEEGPLAAGDGEAIKARVRVLSRLTILSDTGFPVSQCPGTQLPDSPEVLELRKNCPSEGRRIGMVAIPRVGGVFWPKKVDERAKYDGLLVYSVRVIIQHLAPHGAMQTTDDYVVQRTQAGFRIVEIHSLLVGH